MRLANTDQLGIIDWVVLWVTDLGTRSWSMFNPKIYHLIKIVKVCPCPSSSKLTWLIVLIAVPYICWLCGISQSRCHYVEEYCRRSRWTSVFSYLMSVTFPLRILGILHFLWTLQLALVIFVRLYVLSGGMRCYSSVPIPFILIVIISSSCSCISAQLPVLSRRKFLYFTWFWRHVRHITVRNFFLIVSEWVK
jgi:hypothetical protein